ncbi:hypothetical protein ACIBU0_39625 [Streptomyces sp. NPDC049627]|uniref:hypothetical protein n=1 Tax=Streptomyces sp. NPDC049627 TaxID=3365595 RepID=UPI0037BBEE98
MPYLRHRLTIVTLSVVAVFTTVLLGSGPASAQDVQGRLCADGSASLDVEGAHLSVGRGAQDDCVSFGVG